MASTFNRVNGRGHRTTDEKCTCTECKQVYRAWKFIGNDGRCYACHGYTSENESLIAFIQSQKAENVK